MSDAAIDLLRDPAPREVLSERTPAEILASLEAAGSLAARVVAPNFVVTQRGGKKSNRYPGGIYGVVEPAGAGSRLAYTIGLPEHIRLVLRVWGVISVLVIALGLFMAGAALFVGEYQSVFFALWLPALVLAVWWHWRRMGSRAPELEEQFRRVVGPSA